jgi:CheY-like chemotaxis protein
LPVEQADIQGRRDFPRRDVGDPAHPQPGFPLTDNLAPIQPVNEATGALALTIDDNPFAGVKILVVDDDFRNIFAMTALLERGSAEVITAESAVEAISILEGIPDIDLVLMDIMMPDMDGYSAIRAIRTLDLCENLTIVAVTGKVVLGERDRCIAAGADDFTPKPVDTDSLLRVVCPWIAAKRRRTGKGLDLRANAHEMLP